jgi:hypothetical protein
MTNPNPNLTESNFAKWKNYAYQRFKNPTSKDKMLFRILRIKRTVALSFALFGCGYTSGLIEYATDPAKADKVLMMQVVQGAKGKTYRGRDSKEYQAVHRVGSRVISAAQSRVKSKIANLKIKRQVIESEIKQTEIEQANLKLALKNKDTSLSINDTQNLHEKIRDVNNLINSQLMTKNNIIKELEPLELAVQKLKGDWHYIVIDSPSVNAFVSDLCPRRIFVHEGLFEQCRPTDDELAMVLGHEVSHLILGHVKHKNDLHFTVGFVALISMSFFDPSGVTGFLFDYCLEKLSGFLEAAHSREAEKEADLLGIEIAAAACYDTAKGAKIFNKFDVLSGHSCVDWSSTHPSSSSRYHLAQERSQTLNAGQMSECKTILELFMRRAGKSVTFSSPEGIK